MHPCRTALVGLFLFSCSLLASADVSELYNVGDLRQDLPAEVPFWWMNERSPFKRAVLGVNSQLDLSDNPFLSGSANSLFENVSPSGFISQQQQVAQGYNQNPFLNSGSPQGSSYGYLPPVREPVTIPCQGQGQVCVARQACANGFILAQNVQNAGRGQNCQADSEVCCRVQVPVTTTQRPSVPCNQPNNFCVPPQACSNGVIIGQNRLQASPRCFSPDVCCRYVPEPTISESTILTNEGYVIKVPQNKLEPQPNSPTPSVFVPRPQPTITTPQYIPPPIVTTQRPYVPPVVTTQRPYVPPVIVTTTKAPFQANGYIPPRDNEIGQPSNDRPSNVLPPIRGEAIKPLPIYPQQPQPTFQDDLALIPSACPAAMNCTEEQFCTATGVISKTPVVLTAQQAEFRVPMTNCRDSKKGIIGKCCRDPDYVDPWPATILGQYNAEILGFDDGSYKPTGNGNGNGNGNQKFQTQQNTVIRGQAQLSRPIQQSSTNSIVLQQQTQRFDQVPSASGTCGIRNENAIPRGAGQFDTGFGEYTWQAMVLMQSNKSLLCGGALIDENTVATAAHCVNGVNHRDLKVKCGEWKLGIDDEPKPFQIVGVKQVSVHPGYNPTNFDSDMALLHLDERVRYDQHVGPICLEDEYSGASQDCVTTGWGKDVLRIHLKGAIMKQVPMQELGQNECSSALGGYGYNPQSSVCCRARAGDACDADVGSALACRTSNGNYVMKGVYATETECASSNQVVTFAKMDVNWIRQTIRNPGAQQHVQHQPIHQVQQSQTIYNRQEVIAQPNNPQLFAIPTQAPQYLPPL